MTEPTVEWQIVKLPGEPARYRFYKGDDFHGRTLNWFPTLEEIDAILRKYYDE